ncbi:hypothetical protein TrLO_g15898 [Triparma laevis f. longispina]|uniref:Uncharacterized protein n=1 Tax=Triparma laevis f. longispina TaxID=1714387 RepID=A0A9W7A1C5_9STRA|nr:hypothetical protein TrLO_g15898 [Triparma laevis f. longispina]
MDKQTKLKQTTTVFQVLIEASKFNSFPYPQWFLSFSLFGSFFTMPVQPLELLMLFLVKIYIIPFLGNCISAKTKERCQVLTSILALPP